MGNNEKMGLNEKIIKILKSLYRNTRAKFNLGNIETNWVESKRGLRQGCTLSPLLFTIYLEELAMRIRNTNIGINVNGEKLGALMFADDIILITETKEELQTLLNEIRKYEDANMKFSHEKSKILIVNEDARRENRQWKLGNNILEKVKEY